MKDILMYLNGPTALLKKNHNISLTMPQVYKITSVYFGKAITFCSKMSSINALS